MSPKVFNVRIPEKYRLPYLMAWRRQWLKNFADFPEAGYHSAFA